MDINSFNLNSITEVKHFTTQFTITKDITIPDYMNDIKEILLNKSCITVDSNRLSQDRIYVTGRSGYKLLLLGEEENDFYSLSGEIPFDEVIKSDCPEGSNVCILATIDEDNAQMLHQRKVRLSLVVTLDACWCNEEELSVLEDISDDNNIFTKKISTTLPNLIYSGCDEIFYKNDIVIDDKLPSIDEICFYDYLIKDVYTINQDDGYSLGLNLELFIIYKSYESPNSLNHITKTFNIKTYINAPNTIGQLLYVSPSINECIVGREDSENNESPLTITLKASVYSEIYSLINKEIVADAYACNGTLELSRPERCILEPQLLHCDTSICEAINLETEITDSDILFSSASINVCSQEVVCDSLVINYIVIPTIYYKAEGSYREATKTIAGKVSLPINKQICINNSMTLSKMVVNDITVQTSGKEITVKTDVNVSALIKECSDTQVICDQNLIPNPEKTKKHIVCYFVKEGDDVFSICQKYRVSPEDLNKQNADLSLTPGSKIYIFTSRGAN